MGPRSNKSSLGLKSLIYFDSDVVTARHGHQCMRWFYFFCLFQSSRYGTVDGNINIQPLYKFSIKTFDPYNLRWKDCSEDIFRKFRFHLRELHYWSQILRKFLGHCDLKSFSDTYNPTSLFPSLSSSGFLLHWNESIQLIKFLYSGIKTSERLPPLSILVHLRELTTKMDFFCLNLGIKNPRLRAAKNRNDSTSPIFPNGIRDCWSTMTCWA